MLADSRAPAGVVDTCVSVSRSLCEKRGAQPCQVHVKMDQVKCSHANVIT